MKKILFVASLLLSLSACTPDPMPSTYLVANQKVYSQIEPDFYLKNKIIVDNVTYQADNARSAPLYANAADALAHSLSQANMLAPDQKSGAYRLSGVIKNVGWPSCMFGSCETGSAINYTMTDIKTGKTVYDETLVVPYMSEYPFGGQPNFLATLGGAVGENYAHLIHVLSMKKQKDF